MISEFAYVVFLLLVLPYIESASRQRLNEYISHYEPVRYDAARVHREHARARRSADDGQLLLAFTAHGRSFGVRLRRDLSAFTHDYKVEGPGGVAHSVNTSHIYHGELIDEPGSVVFGSVSDGVFEGKIVSGEGVYYVERARRYFAPPIAGNATDKSFHSLIYRDADVGDPYAHQRHGHVGGCGITDEVVQWMERVQNSAVEDETTSPPPPLEPAPRRHAVHPNSLFDEEARFSEDFMYNKYSRAANTRAKRATRPKDDNRNTCSLYIQTDPLIWRHVREGFPDHRDKSKKAEVDEKTREEILSLIAHHVTAVNYIYRDTKFDGRMEHRNIKFEVQRIKIDDDSACNTHHFAGELNQFCLENIDVSNFLNLHSLGNHEDFCLAYVFTYRDFTGGTLGLAWVASASGASGGICEKYKTYTETIGGMYQSTKRSLNTGIITFVNYNSRVPPKVSQLTLAHEIGHNFGSPHDYPAECRPGGPAGNYIMFASATSGDRPNNSRFSQCSVGNISAVLDAVRDGRKRNCLSASAGAFCGNKIVEAGEECDCGYDDKECTDRCCYPRLVSELERQKNETARGCHRRYNTQCSPSQGPCCHWDTCSFITSSRYHTCRAAGECARAAHCDGRSADCPRAKPLPNKTRCNNGTQLCIAGECSGSICLEWNMTECFLSSSPTQIGDGVSTVIDRRALCQLACQMGDDPRTCRSTAEFASAVGLPPGGISLRPGSPCDNFQGYCDNLFRCQGVDSEGPLERLKKQLQESTNPPNSKSPSTNAPSSTASGANALYAPGFCLIHLYNGLQGYCDVFLKCRAVDAEGPLARLKNLLLNRATLLTVAAWVTEHWWAVLLAGVALVCCLGAFVKCCAVHTPSSNPKQPPARRISETLRRPMNTLRRMRRATGGEQRTRGAPRPGYQGGRGHYHQQLNKASAPPGPSRRTEPYAGAYPGPAPAYELRPPQKV